MNGVVHLEPQFGLATQPNHSLIYPWKEAGTSKADIVCAQETHFKAFSPIRIHILNFPHIFMACSDKKKAAVFLAIKNSLAFNLHPSYVDPGGRFVILVCNINTITCTLVNVYAPNSRQISFLNRVRRQVKRLKTGSLIWYGDFNAVADPSCDTTS